MGSVSFSKIALYLLTGLIRGGLCVFFLFVCFLSDYRELCFMACVKVQISADFCGVFAQGRQGGNAQVERLMLLQASVQQILIN